MNRLTPPVTGDEVRSIAALVNCPFREIPDKTIRVQRAMAEGMKKARTDGWPDDQKEMLHAAALQLFDAEQYENTLLLALALAMQAPVEPRFLILAGRTLQQLGDPLLATVLFRIVTLVRPDHAEAAFRLIECYALIGRQPDAAKIFETVIDGGHGQLGDSGEFYAKCQQAIDAHHRGER